MDFSGPQETVEAPLEQRDFIVESQSVAFEIDFQRQLLTGKTEIRVQPRHRDVKKFSFDCRQCNVTKAFVEGRRAEKSHFDPDLDLRPHPRQTISQHHFLKRKVDEQLSGSGGEQLTIYLPRRVEIRESEQYKAVKLEPVSVGSQDEALDVVGRFAPLTIIIEFETSGRRDGLQWVGCIPGDDRWPQVYTRISPSRSTASSIFPCVDHPHSRHPWDISITCSRTLGGAFKRKASEPSAGTEDGSLAHGTNHSDINGTTRHDSPFESDEMGLGEDEKSLELSVVCSGELTGEEDVRAERDMKTCRFYLPASVSASQIGFAVGPFEDVDLSEFREIDDDEKLGEAAISVHGYSLPGRAAEIRNACMPLAKAIDFFTTTFTTYTGESFKLCFVDDLLYDTTEMAGLSICSTRLLFGEEVIDPLPSVTRILVHTLASQWAGIHLVPKERNDSWTIAGIAAFMTDVFLKSLTGNNEYRYQQKLAADRVYEQDLNRPSLYDLGAILDLDPEESRFMSLKAGVVFFILDRRLVKSSGSAGMTRIIGRILNNAKGEEADSSYITTTQFISLCNKMGHTKLEPFFQQWVQGAGCPSFQVLQEMNKKKLMVLMTIHQNHLERSTARKDLNPSNFMREVKEDLNGVWAGEVPSHYVGSMTIRIHESDGTPYEHVVDISKGHMKIEIPYNTKYKRMKRGRRQKERGIAAGAENADAQDDVLLYCLGDILQSEEDVAEWRLVDWDPEMEQKMGEESYEWIRMDADFEWIGKLNIRMPSYMWMSQLQQDRDVVAQMESLQWVSYETSKTPHPLISTFLIRTLLDERYFHGIRTMAAARLPNLAKQEVDWIGLFHLQKAFERFYCMPDSQMPRPNDFSDRVSYIVQQAILEGLAEVRDNSGRAPLQVKKFFLEKLKFNDNSSNDYSDSHYVSTVMSCLTQTLLGPPTRDDYADVDSYVLQREAVAEIERYRRINEWTSSFHNVFTTTALDCLVRLAKAGVVQPKFKEFMQYTSPENSDQARIKAFECLVELDMLKSDSVMAYLIHELSTDPSPYMRANLYRILGRGLGKIAMGEDIKEQKEAPTTDGLVIEQESTQLAEVTQAQVDRRQTVSGAMSALKDELGASQSFQKAMWAAVKSPVLSLREVSNLLDICAITFDTSDALPVILKLPRYWTVQHTGQGKLVFKKTGSYRTRVHVPPTLPPKSKPPTISIATPQSAFTIPRPSLGPVQRRQSSSARSPVGPVLLTNGAAASPSIPTDQPKRTILKLKTFKSTTPSTATVAAHAPHTAPPAVDGSTATPTYFPNGNPAYTNGNTTTAPFGFGKITASPAPEPDPPVPAVPTQHVGPKAMSPPPRPESAMSATSAGAPSQHARRKSSTPKSAANKASSAASSRAGSPAYPANGAVQSNAAAGGTEQPAKGKKRKSETPQPVAAEPPPAKKMMLKLNLGRSLSGTGSGSGAGGSGGPPG